MFLSKKNAKLLADKIDSLAVSILRTQQDMNELQRSLCPRINAEVERALGDKIEMIEGSLRESILQKEILIDKGFMTRDEINAKYAALKRN